VQSYNGILSNDIDYQIEKTRIDIVDLRSL
jgi:hypothetical protein